jgi:hypothetical protein
MSDSERPEALAFRELEQLVRHLGDELAGFRRRALLAESRVRDLESEGAQPEVRQQRELGDRMNQLEHENAILRSRLEAATERTRAMLERVRFIRQQAQGAER